MIGKRVLVVAAHPDDDVLGCGGLMSKFRHEKEFKIIFLAEGTSCRYKNINDIDCLAEIKLRNQMSRDALALLGVAHAEYYNLPCGRLDQHSQIELNKIIEDEINKFQPDTLITHSESDLNVDHKIVNRSTLIASRPGKFHSLKSLLTFEVLSSSELAYQDPFKPNYYVKLSDQDLTDKIKALQKFTTEVGEFPFPRSEEGVRTLANYRGMQSGFHRAEAYNLIRFFEI